jgi:hypothetical protein
VRLVLADGGAVEVINPGGDVVVAEKGCTPDRFVQRVKAKKLSTAQAASLKVHIRSARGAIGVLRNTDLPTAPQIVSPMFGAAVLSERPSFSWPAAPKADGYRIELFSGGKRLIWSADTKEPRCDYPKKESELKRGKCIWRVLVKSDGKEREVLKSQFTVLTAEERKTLTGLSDLAKSDDVADWLLAAATYEAHGVFGEALPLLEKASSKNPADANLHRALASYYQRAGRKDRADESTKKAEKLEKK